MKTCMGLCSEKWKNLSRFVDKMIRNPITQGCLQKTILPRDYYRGRRFSKHLFFLAQKRLYEAVPAHCLCKNKECNQRNHKSKNILDSLKVQHPPQQNDWPSITQINQLKSITPVPSSCGSSFDGNQLKKYTGSLPMNSSISYTD